MGSNSIAIIGLGCRFPAADGPEQLWQNLLERKTTFGPVPSSRYPAERFAAHPKEALKIACSQGSFLEDIDLFAHRHFGVPPRRAETMDPQQRLLLEVADQAWADAGLQKRPPDRGRSGVFVGMVAAEYSQLLSVVVRAQQLESGQFGQAQDCQGLVERAMPPRAYTVPGGMCSMAAAVVAQTFDLQGPSYSVDSACASSMFAIVNAMQHLRSLPPCADGPRPIAIAGGAYLNLSPDLAVGFSRAGVVSQQACRPFDRGADGFLLGEGVGLLVLKRLEDAQADGDRIHAVIGAGVIASDGRAPNPMVPLVEGQVRTLELGLADAGWTAESIDYFECHGTATVVGDQVELAALDQVFGPALERRGQRAWLGSIKANLGHTLAASGVASVLRAILAIKHATLPPQAGWDDWHPELARYQQRFEVGTSSQAWSNPCRRAHVSSFGFGGHNSALLLEQAPAVAARNGSEGGWLVLSALSPKLLLQYLRQVESRLLRAKPADLHDIAFTLARSRTLYAHRLLIQFGPDGFDNLEDRLRGVVQLPEGDVCSELTTAVFYTAGEERPPGFAWPEVGSICDFPLPPLEKQSFWVVRKDQAPANQRSSTEVSLEAIRELVAQTSGFPVSSVLPEHRLDENLGFDSILAQELRLRILASFGNCPKLEFWQSRPTVADVADEVARLPQRADFRPAQEWDISRFPEVLAIERRQASFEQTQTPWPFFPVRDEATYPADFSLYNYLGLSRHPQVLRAAQQAVERWGTSAGASRLVAGDLTVHRELEVELAEFLGLPSALVFVSGHATNGAVIRQMVGPGDLILHDSLIHDSIIQGTVGSRAARLAFRHNDMEHLGELLRQHRHLFRRALIVVEGLYSMDGDLVPLPALLQLKEHYQALLMVDEAHSLGTLGPAGRGIAEQYGVDPNLVDIWTGTLSKALGSCGGFVAGASRFINYLRLSNPSFLYSVGASPANAAAALAALRILRAEPTRVVELQSKSRWLLDQLRHRGFPTGTAHDSPIIPVIFGSDRAACLASQYLATQGVQAMPILHPAVPLGTSRLRFFVTSEHSQEQMELALRALDGCRDLS